MLSNASLRDVADGLGAADGPGLERGPPGAISACVRTAKESSANLLYGLSTT